MTSTNAPAAVLLALAGVLHGGQLASGDFTVELAPDFPAPVCYTYRGDVVALPAGGSRVVRINGRDHRPEVGLAVLAPDAAEYELRLADAGVVIRARFTLGREALVITLPEIRETGALAVRSVEIPGLVLLAGDGASEVALGNFPAASYASEKPADHDIFGRVAEVAFGDNEANPSKNRDPAGNRGASYAFVSNGRTAAGLYSNVMEENLRAIVRLDGQGDARTIAVAPGKWTHREIPAETCPAPTAVLVVAADANADGRVTWHDAALAYRRNVPHPYGAESTRLHPIAHIAMNFGSQATNPFLRVLDNAKKVWLLTDGLGQRIQFKGFAGEGHDSSHPDYAGNVGRRMGGRDELNFVMRRGHDFNVQSGVHINAHEYHREARWFSPDIVDAAAVGWSWLDESYLTDYRHDSAYGTLYQRLDAMRADLPWLDFVYLDVYYGRGWPGWRMHTRVNSHGLLQFTEFPGVMERAVVWNHVANDWTQQVGGKGDRSAIARFIWFSHKDTFRHEPLLRGSNCDGFMGWHAERSLPQLVKSAFTVNLPTKYLQHFELLQQERDRARFSRGVRTEFDGRVAAVFGRDGQLVNSCRYAQPDSRPVDSLSFIPWDPAAEDKIYHWNDRGGESTWQLPASWGGVGAAQLYRLTDLGRVFEREVPVRGGKVTLEKIAPDTPYVLYRDTPPALPAIEWGEGGLVRDPGFDSHSFTAWRLAGAAGTARIENDARWGQTELVAPTPAAAEVRQTAAGLAPGETYAASVWLSIEGQREAGLAVEPAPPQPPPFIDKGAWRVVAAPRQMGGDRARHMLDGNPETIWHSEQISAENANPLPHHIVLDLGTEHMLAGFVQTARANLHNGAIKGFRAAVSPDNQEWNEVASGEFDYRAGTAATVVFASPAKARYFRLTATSEVQGRPFTSVAELDLLFAPERSSNVTFTPVANTVDATRLTNFTDQSSKYLRNWHRLRVLFTAPPDGRVDLVLRAAAGQGTVRFDDVRLVRSGVSRPPADAGKVVLFEDFEHVDEGWGPFMYGWQGPMNTHLSEANPPHTNDTIAGGFSLKTRREGSPEMIYRTVPATLKLRPGTACRVSFDYLCDTAGCFALVTGHDAEEGQQVDARHPLDGGEWQPRKFSATVTTGAAPGAFLGVAKLAKDKTGTLVIDNFLVTE